MGGAKEKHTYFGWNFFGTDIFWDGQFFGTKNLWGRKILWDGKFFGTENSDIRTKERMKGPNLCSYIMLDLQLRWLNL